MSEVEGAVMNPLRLRVSAFMSIKQPNTRSPGFVLFFALLKVVSIQVFAEDNILSGA
jgi:hypothetical protein